MTNVLNDLYTRCAGAYQYMKKWENVNEEYYMYYKNLWNELKEMINQLEVNA